MRRTLLLTGLSLTLSFAAPPMQAEKSSDVAYAMAMAGTFGPLVAGTLLASEYENSRLAPVLILGGLFIGPSTGQFYAQSVGRGLVATALRTAGAGLFIAGVTTWDGGGQDAYDGERILYGSILFLGGTVYSITDTRKAVDRYEQRTRTGAYGFSPTLTSAQGEGLRPGAMAYLRF